MSDSEAKNLDRKLVADDNSFDQITYIGTDATESENSDSIRSIYPDEWALVDHNAEQKAILRITTITDFFCALFGLRGLAMLLSEWGSLRYAVTSTRASLKIIQRLLQ